jgi:hypothetical protein
LLNGDAAGKLWFVQLQLKHGFVRSHHEETNPTAWQTFLMLELLRFQVSILEKCPEKQNQRDKA